jgi:hypothetical protein
MEDKMRISSYYSRNDAMQAAVERWERGNDAGEGFAPGAELEGAEIVLRAENDGEVDVYKLADGREIAVADAHGPWAVDITHEA